MKTSELTGGALDWAVAKCEGYETLMHKGVLNTLFTDDGWRPSTDWSQGGPIIEQELIELSIDGRSLDGMWVAKSPNWYQPYVGPTPLIAAMRAYVASVLGDEVEIPEELA